MKPSPKINFKRQAGATLIEYFCNLARTSGTLWDGHNAIYARHRAWLTTLLDDGGQVPVMYSSKRDLLFDVWQTHDCSRISEYGEALLTTGKRNTRFFGIEQLWVKANSTRYQDAMLAVWKKVMHEANPNRHKAAALVFSRCLDQVAKKELRAELSPEDRGKLMVLLKTRKAAHFTAASGQPQPRLMSHFDCTLNGDHVFSATALKPAEDAWVWLFPVPANANQGFGAKVEQRYLPLKTTTNTRFISPGMVYKLLASAMPRNSGDSDLINQRVRGQLGSSVKALERLALIESFVQHDISLDRT